ncbi:uncharacterized protein SCHCODRAFT_02630455 [Schizophyllum commune H4-8]|uniref:uncharacterized protein n=1 Tax=Schizophyllum commune (strain H4-8 / FGSC 9210) TaxID=578458 RepID=UPI00215EC141|nr:uncharacterized protein SCHCODRAFT_02630455 [Schizophyllum commune H4-8]KAI5889945.1 hypothetical protein SCHCODRAFT_02630455 [Schizophyllum commune H4-8]
MSILRTSSSLESLDANARREHDTRRAPAAPEPARATNRTSREPSRAPARSRASSSGHPARATAPHNRDEHPAHNVAPDEPTFINYNSTLEIPVQSQYDGSPAVFPDAHSHGTPAQAGPSRFPRAAILHPPPTHLYPSPMQSTPLERRVIPEPLGDAGDIEESSASYPPSQSDMSSTGSGVAERLSLPLKRDALTLDGIQMRMYADVWQVLPKHIAKKHAPQLDPWRKATLNILESLMRLDSLMISFSRVRLLEPSDRGDEIAARYARYVERLYRVLAALEKIPRGRMLEGVLNIDKAMLEKKATQVIELEGKISREIYAFARHHYRQHEARTQAQIDARTATWNEEKARWSQRLQAGKEERERMKRENESLGELIARLQGAGIIAA